MFTHIFPGRARLDVLSLFLDAGSRPTGRRHACYPSRN